MKNLESTITMMASDDYKERFRAEYWQTKIRYEKLKHFNDWIEASEMVDSIDPPEHDCPLYLLREQQSAMGQYLHTLELRAIIEAIDLEMLERTDENGEFHRTLIIDPEVGSRIERKYKSKCGVTGGRMGYGEDGELTILTNQISMDEILKDQKGA